MNSISVITLVHQREEHLKNLVRGLSQSRRLPEELLIVHMNEEDTYSLPSTPFPVRQYQVHSPDTKIPLASARNKGANRANGDLLIFLDVDCIPADTLVDNYWRAQQQFDGLIMGDIRYLPPGGLSKNWSFDELKLAGVAHLGRPEVSKLLQPTDHYELFWSLTFAISQERFNRIGGFDTQYQGYGAEDTDFAFTARQRSVPFALNKSVCYHQHHAVYRPPLQHFADIVSNARRFYDKWGSWPMESWLQAFEERGLINWNQNDSALEILSYPTSEAIEAAYCTAPAGF